MATLSDYELRHLASHLEHAGRAGDLHRLLRLHRPRSGAGRDPALGGAGSTGRPAGAQRNPENAWFAAKEAIGDAAGYSDDVRRAWRGGEAASRQEVQGKRPATGIGLQVRYALITASIDGLAESIPPALTVELVAKGIWAPSHALAYARRMPRAYEGQSAERAETLVRLATSPLGEASAEARVEALAAARQVEAGDTRARLLGALAPHLPEEEQPGVWEEAIRAAARAPYKQSQASALAALAPSLPVARRAEVWRQALAATGEAPPSERPRLLQEMVPNLPAELIEEAAAIAERVRERSWRLQSVRAVLPRLPQSLRLAILGRAFDTAMALADRGERANALAALAPYLPQSLLERAVRAARALDRDPTHLHLLALLAPRLPARDREAALEEALAAALACDDGWRARILAALAPQLRAGKRARAWTKALSAARAVEWEHERARVLQEMAPHVPTEHLRAAVVVALTIEDTYERTQVLQALAAHRPQARRAEVLREAVAALPTGDESLLPRALESLVPVLPDELLADVFALITSLQELHWKREVLAVVAPRLPAFMLSQALVEARRIGDGAEAAQTVAEISSLLPLTERRAALRDALALALTIGNDFQRASALAALAAALPQPERAQALAAGLAAARAVRNRYERVEALVSIGGHMPEEGRAAPLSEALADVKAIGEHAEDSSVREALADLAPQLPQPMLGEALRTARRISHRGHRAWALATLVPHLSGARRIRVIGEALSDAGATDDDYARLAAVETLASCLPQRFVPQALSVAQGIGDSIWCQSALVTLAPRMTPRQRTQLLGEDWETAYAEAARTERVLALASRAAHLPEEERSRAAHEALSIRDDSSRLEALVALIPHLPEGARDEALTAGLTLARAIVDPYARAVSLARLAPAIPGSGRGRTLETALAAARAVHDRPSRLKALATVAGALPAARRARVLAEALDAAAGSRDQAGGPPVRRRSDILADVRALGPSIASLGGAPAIGAVLQAILDVEAWWP